MSNIWSTSILAIVPLLVNFVSTEELLGCQKTSWYSEKEGYPSDRMHGFPVTGLACKGSLCAYLQAIQCTNLSTEDGDNIDLRGVNCEELVTTFSEHPPAEGYCPNNKFVEGVKCEDDDCDNIRLHCCEPVRWTADHSQPQETQWFDPGQGQQCPVQHVVFGARCKGYYCESMQLVCAPVIPDPPVKGGSKGRWVPVCSTNVGDSSCQFMQHESAKRDKQPTWDPAFAGKVMDSIVSNMEFKGYIAGIHPAVVQRMRLLMNELKDVSRPCSVVSQGRGTHSDNVWWQWVMDIDDVTGASQNGEQQAMHLTTCFFVLTPGMDCDPKCTPGQCKDLECQLCKTTEAQIASDSN